MLGKEILDQQKLDLRNMLEDKNMLKELEFTDSYKEEYANWFDNYLGFVNIREEKQWNNFSLGQINFMESLGAHFDSAVYTWTIKKDRLNEQG